MHHCCVILNNRKGYGRNMKACNNALPTLSIFCGIFVYPRVVCSDKHGPIGGPGEFFSLALAFGIDCPKFLIPPRGCCDNPVDLNMNHAGVNGFLHPKPSYSGLRCSWKWAQKHRLWSKSGGRGGAFMHVYLGCKCIDIQYEFRNTALF